VQITTTLNIFFIALFFWFTFRSLRSGRININGTIYSRGGNPIIYYAHIFILTMVALALAVKVIMGLL